MKKTITLLSIFCAVTALAIDVRYALLEESASMSATDILSSQTLDKAISESVSAADYPRIDSRLLYYQCRDAVYTAAFGGYNVAIKDFPGDEGFNLYRAARTIVVAKMKEYLHRGDNLLKTYEASRGAFRDHFRKMPEEAKERSRLKIQEAIAVFKTMKRDEAKKQFAALKKAEKASGSPTLEDLLAKNLSADATARKVLAEAVKVPQDNPEEVFLFGFADPHLAKFAGRRALEGGNALLDKYIAVLNLMAEDAR